MAHTYKMRIGPTSFNQVKNLKYYKTPNPFDINSKTGGNCTWWAWGRFWEVAAEADSKYANATPVSRRNACYFYDDAISNGYGGGLIPKPGAIICWGYGSEHGGDGHVAFVEKVNTNPKGEVLSIEISQSGWSSGPMKNETLTPGNGKRGFSAYHRDFGNTYFNGFIYNPVDFGNPAGAVDVGTGEIAGDSSSAVDMAQRIAKLYSSSNYTRIEYDNEKDAKQAEFIRSTKEKYKNVLSNVKFNTVTPGSAAIKDIIETDLVDNKEQLIKTQSAFDLSKGIIQAPFVELDLNGYVIGSYRASTDDYPNYISRLDIQKVNGEINKYTIGITYQIRAGEDPNLLDKLFSTVRYNKIKIRYGDCESGALFKDSEAVITNIVQNRDYAGSRITYTVYATSACNYVTSLKFNFKSTVDRPSNVLRELLWYNPETSQILQDAFPGMANQTEVENKGLLPSNDAEVKIEAKPQMSLLQYVNYLVGCMSNNTNSIDDVTKHTSVLDKTLEAGSKFVNGLENFGKKFVSGIDNFFDNIGNTISNAVNFVRKSTYFITYEDDSDKGSYFKITEVEPKQTVDKRSAPSVNVYNITVGYPDGNDVLNFSINNNSAWSLLYKYSGVSSEYLYGLDSNGNKIKTYSPNINGSTNILNEMQKNWWTQMITFPLSAQLQIRGLLKPISLMDYINIDVIFYGERHITSGLYVVVGQQDILSGNGFATNLSLIRVGD